MQLLPQSTKRPLRRVIVILATLYLLNGIAALRVAILGHWFYAVLAICFWFPLAIGLWLQFEIARKTAVGFQVLCLFFIPMTIGGKWAGFDSAPFHPKFPWWAPFSLMLFLGTINCFAIFVLHKHRAEFKPSKS